MPNSIIVYRNPIEQQMWEGTICGFPVILAAILFAIIVVAIFIFGHWIYRTFKKNRYGRYGRFS